LENLIIDGTRRMREWEQLQGEIPSLEMALKFSERPGVNLKNLNLSADEWKVISFINPKNTIHQIARATNKNDLEIRKIVYSFIQAGLVEMVRPEGRPVQPVFQSVEATPAAQPRIIPAQTNKPEFKSLINRIITRIRSI
jgi:hypothetical protein